MKRLPLHIRPARMSGFTLVELLVVMGIIAILAGVLFSAGTAAIRAANRAKAANLANQIQTAVMNYYGEYSVYPVPTATTADVCYSDTDGTDWATLDCILCGNIRPSTGATFTAPTAGPTNTRSIAFLNIKSGDVFTASSTTGTQDAPKNPLPNSSAAGGPLYFNIVMNSSYSGVIGSASNTAQLGATSPSTAVLPNFNASSTGSIPLSGTTTMGAAVWANCNATSTTTYWNPNFFVKTF